MEKHQQLIDMLDARRQAYREANANIFEHLGDNIRDAIATLCGIDPHGAEDRGSIFWVDIAKIGDEGFIITLVVSIEDVADSKIFTTDDLIDMERAGSTAKIVKFGITKEMLSMSKEEIINMVNERVDDGEMMVVSMKTTYGEHSSTQKAVIEQQHKNTNNTEFDLANITDSQKLSLALMLLLRD